ncbi:uncharacterized protein LOC128988152 [Macrosteles quadrilineatus]|uniref:uncharacterized protein LOC128988152 n=1 Tax=Macrosteles quadrilineatus TaxID=74068 RepID=UPI0023E23AAC|nr:uncharacterized protein LOC128988152 [Macrosteles quadrilineatus]
MISIRHMCKRWFFFLSLATATAIAGGSRAVFPRMDYDEWTPLGRGDPLKNDPTYDYVPPVLDRVNYWLEPEARTPDPQILLLGASSGKPEMGKMKKQPQADSRRDIFNPLMQLIERKHTGRLRPQYIPLQGGYMYKTSPMRLPYTVLVPPPPVQRPTVPVSSTTPPDSGTTAPPPETEGTTYATSEATASTTNIHKVLSPLIDIQPSGQQSLSSSLLQIILQNEMASTPPTSTTTTTTPHPALTTDPLFSHYKQPAEPLRGPMYLIIQGHSKVKTYGASGIDVQEDNEVGDRRRRSRQIDLEDFLPVEETLEALAKDYLDDDTVEGSGLKTILAAAIGS